MRLGLRTIPALVGAFLLLFSSFVGAQHDHDEKKETVPRTPDARRSTIQPEGLRSNPPRRFAIVGATVHRRPNHQPKVETILIDGSKIVAVGANVELPAGTKIVDAKGKHCYAGFIDSFHEIEFEFLPDQGTGYWNDNVRPQLQVSRLLEPDDLDAKELRDVGFTTVLVAPSDGVIKGQSSLVLLSDATSEHLLLDSDTAQHLELTTRRGRGSGYPNSPMGAVALARQAMYDANWYRDAWKVTKSDASVELPEVNSSLESLQNVTDNNQLVMIETSNELFAGRADRFAREFGLNLIILGSGNEYRRLNEVVQLGRPIVLPINFPKPPDVSSAEKAAETTLEDMMHWDFAPANPAMLAENNVNFVFTTKGIEKKEDFLSHLRNAVKRGLPKDIALAALTTRPANLFGVDEKVGQLESSMLANITITDGDLFAPKTKIVETWIDGQRYEKERSPLRDVVGTWELAGKGFDGMTLRIRKKSSDVSATISASTESSKKQGKGKNGNDPKAGVDFKSVELVGTRLTGAFNNRSFGDEGMSLVSLLVATDGTASGRVTLPNGSSVEISATRRIVTSSEKADTEWDELVEQNVPSHSKAGHKHGSHVVSDSKPASFEVNYPLGAYGRSTEPAQPKSVLIKNVTIWTLDKQGKLENAALLFGGGSVMSLHETGSELPEADIVIDGDGGHLTPGIIDCHSHMATDSGVNESGQAITAEVRIGDMVDCDDINIYRQLAGGVTSSNILHGSANPIGGQNQVIKLRWGAGEQAMKFKGAPLGIKFALGENVKQSNWSNPTDRYPQTRMGVEQLIDDAFRAAKDYGADWNHWKEKGRGLPPRRNLELDALLEIVEGKRWVHCHSYRQDEILALIRTLDKHEIQIGSFQHILEGYKVADKMAEHGAMGSAFADWWAYKYEVKDAIPFAGALMHRAGVVVSFNSDDSELGRHLNQEAAKAVKYGAVPEVEALKFVTLNPARQLRIDDRVGSLEVGKDADLVLWNGHPLSNLSRVKQTWVDGRKYFDRDEDLKSQARNQEMRLTLIQKILMSGEKMESKDKSNVDPAKLWPRHDEFCHQHGYSHDE